MSVQIAFGSASYELQKYLPGTDPDLLPDSSGLDAPPRPNAIASPVYTPGSDGSDTLFGGHVIATTDSDPVAHTVLDVVGPWNSVKNAVATGDDAASLTFSGFVHVDAIVGRTSDARSDVELLGAKRGNVVTGAGDDLVNIQFVQNDDDWATPWSREFRVASGEGNDTVHLSPLDVDAAAATDPTFGSAVAASLTRGYAGWSSSAWVDLGGGADVFSVGGEIRTTVAGGDGDDWIAGGQRSDVLAGGPGADTLSGGASSPDMYASDQLDGGAGDDLLLAAEEASGALNGGDGNDTLYGSHLSDTITGGAGDDALFGDGAGGAPGGGDLLEGDAGNDQLTGSGGSDTALYAGRAADYEVLRLEDGRAAVRDLNPADGDEGTDALTDVERLRFSDRTVELRDPTAPRFMFNGRQELWVSDGTAAGTWMVWHPSTYGQYEDTNLASLGAGRALFGTREGNGSALWITDGTADGTRLVRDTSAGFQPRAGSWSSGPTADPPHNITDLGNGHAVFGVQHDQGEVGLSLWVTDGTTTGTELIRSFASVAGVPPLLAFVSLGDGRVLFAAEDTTLGRELWVTDGTAVGTALVKDINPGWSGSDTFGTDRDDRNFVALGDGRALFSAKDAAHGPELWVSDGTAAGTRLVADIYPGSADWAGGPHDFVALGDGRALFVAYDGAQGKELWASDGTAAGTRLVADINPGGSPGWPAWSNPHDFVALGGGRALFVADDGVHGPELWVSDGSTVGTRLVKDIDPRIDGYSGPGGLVGLGNGRALFAAGDGAHGKELWVSDGTATGTELVGHVDPLYLTGLGDGRAVFNVHGRPEDGSEALGWWAWVSDGTAVGTVPLAPVYPGYGHGVILDPFG
ncbi:hypothetical protein [Paracraurococcus lichenis]|uniref:Calcium-binding protein n=1 Tax=Paracraurococcus lichenis TaxID=3064888 RepID=A0ABT9E9K9_9PROT|nr:hypothetical protein [Paracraurococcus sp. LOR1-02]MDO9712745.1 hypothetical protein [Paracraurococcus sp. LOR1-02]